MKREFLKEVEATGYIHYPLPLHTENSLEAALENKEVLARKEIWNTGSLENLRASGSAVLTLTPAASVCSGAALTMTSPIRSDRFPEGFDPPARYINYSIAKIHLPKEKYEGRGLNLIKVAKEDFGFALEEFEQYSYRAPVLRGHERTTGESLYYALASEAASRIYEATGEKYYAEKAEYFADLMLKFQETGETSIPITGFFYRDPEHKYPQHFNHQSREQGFMRALVLLCETQKENPKLSVWENAMKLYAQYLKDLMKYSAPYTMIPSGRILGRRSRQRRTLRCYAYGDQI